MIILNLFPLPLSVWDCAILSWIALWVGKNLPLFCCRCTFHHMYASSNADSPWLMTSGLTNVQCWKGWFTASKTLLAVTKCFSCIYPKGHMSALGAFGKLAYIYDWLQSPMLTWPQFVTFLPFSGKKTQPFRRVGSNLGLRDSFNNCCKTVNEIWSCQWLGLWWQLNDQNASLGCSCKSRTTCNFFKKFKYLIKQKAS